MKLEQLSEQAKQHTPKMYALESVHNSNPPEYIHKFDRIHQQLSRALVYTEELTRPTALKAVNHWYKHFNWPESYKRSLRYFEKSVEGKEGTFIDYSFEELDQGFGIVFIESHPIWEPVLVNGYMEGDTSFIKKLINSGLNPDDPIDKLEIAEMMYDAGLGHILKQS